MEFKKADGTKIENVAVYIKEFFFKHTNDDNPYVLWVGCDSVYKGKSTSEYIVAICFYQWGRGAHVIHRKYTLKTTDILDRLWKEVELTVEVAEFLRKENVFVQKLIKRDKDSLMPEAIFKSFSKNKYPNWEEKIHYVPAFMNCLDFRVDVDFNSKYTDHKGKVLESNKLHDSAIYYVEGMGYQCVAKPSAFAATYAAHSLL